MAEFSKGLQISIFRNNGVLIIVALLGIGLVFFLPELLHFKGDAPETVRKKIIEKPVQVEPKKEEYERPLVAQTESPPENTVTRVKLSPLDQISKAIDDGYIEKLRERKRILGAVGASDIGSKLSEPSGVLPTLPTLTWKDIRSDKVVASLKKAQLEALAIAKSIPDNHSQARYALISFIEGISLVMTGGEKVMRADDVPDYLEQIDTNTTNAIAQSDVGSSVLTKWSQVSLGAALQSRKAALEKLQLVPAFNPRIVLTTVEVRQDNNKFKTANRAISGVKIRGSIFGDSIKNAAVYKNGEFVKFLQLSRVPDLSGGRGFSFNSPDAIARYTIRVVAKSGEEYRKSYDFYSRASQFPWEYRSKKFLIPYAPYDPRMDGQFAVATTRVGMRASSAAIRGSDAENSGYEWF